MSPNMAAPTHEENVALNNRMENSEDVFIVGKILHLGLMLTQYKEICEALTEFVDYLDDRVIEDLKDRLDLSCIAEEEDDFDRWQAFEDWCIENKRLGFLCQIEAPKHTGGELHLGVRKIRWFYGETLEEIVDQACAWTRSLKQDGERTKEAQRSTR